MVSDAVDAIIMPVQAWTCYDIVSVEITCENTPGAVGYEQHAKNMGLIKQKYQSADGEFSVISELALIRFVEVVVSD